MSGWKPWLASWWPVAMGAENERAAIVAWLRGFEGSLRARNPDMANAIDAAVICIERGEHLDGGT